MRESLIEKRVSEYAKKKGMLCYKFSSPGQRFVCDRIFMYNGFSFFIEFKSEGGKPTEGQSRHHQLLVKNGMTVYVVDSVSLGIEVINDECEGKRSERHVVRNIDCY